MLAPLESCISRETVHLVSGHLSGKLARRLHLTLSVEQISAANPKSALWACGGDNVPGVHLESIKPGAHSKRAKVGRSNESGGGCSADRNGASRFQTRWRESGARNQRWPPPSFLWRLVTEIPQNQ